MPAPDAASPRRNQNTQAERYRDVLARRRALRMQRDRLRREENARGRNDANSGGRGSQGVPASRGVSSQRRTRSLFGPRNAPNSVPAAQRGPVPNTRSVGSGVPAAQRAPNTRSVNSGVRRAPRVPTAPRARAPRQKFKMTLRMTKKNLQAMKSGKKGCPNWRVTHAKMMKLAEAVRTIQNAPANTSARNLAPTVGTVRTLARHLLSATCFVGGGALNVVKLFLPGERMRAVLVALAGSGALVFMHQNPTLIRLFVTQVYNHQAEFRNAKFLHDLAVASELYYSI